MLVLWIASAALSLLSLFFMAILIASRIVMQRREIGRTEAKHAARGALIAFASDVNESRLFEALSVLDIEVVSEVSKELLDLIRGDIAPKLRAVLERIGVPEYECALLKHGLLPTRLRASEFLAFFPGSTTSEALHEALLDRSHELRISAAISLAKMEIDFDLHALLNQMERAGVKNKRISELVDILFRTNRDRIIALLHDDALGDGLKALLIDGICHSKSPNLLALLTELMKSPKSSEIAATVIRSSAVLGHAQSLKIIAEHLDSSKPELRLAAADGARLLGIPDERLLKGLGRMMESPQWTLRNAASTALQCLGPKGREQLALAEREMGAVAVGLQETEQAYA